MTNRLIRLGLSALIVLGVASSAFAQSPQTVWPAKVSLNFLRTDNGNTPPVYATTFSNGGHPLASVGVASTLIGAAQDTAIVSIADHISNWQGWVPAKFPGTGTAADSFYVGTLRIEASTGADTITVFKDVSPDGVTWTGVDSLVTHTVSGQLGIGYSTVGADSIIVVGTSTSGPGFTGRRVSVLHFHGYWPMGPGGTSPLAAGPFIKFLRFRLHMSGADYAAAGLSGGFTATYEYPSYKPQ